MPTLNMASSLSFFSRSLVFYSLSCCVRVAQTRPQEKRERLASAQARGEPSDQHNARHEFFFSFSLSLRVCECSLLSLVFLNEFHHIFFSMPLLHLLATATPPPPKPPPLSSSPSPRKVAETARKRLAKEALKKQEKKQQESKRKDSSSRSSNSANSNAAATARTPKSPLSASTSQTLRGLSARPKRALGQNFVVDEQVLDSVTRAALGGNGSGSSVGVLEVGPGTGNLTRRLLDFSSKNSSPSSSSSSSPPSFVVTALTAVEKDDALSENLQKTLVAEEPRLKLIHEDFLLVNLPVEVQALRERAAAAAGASSSTSTSSTSSTSSSSSPPSSQPLPLPRAVVVANLPYNITSDALRILLPLGESISDVYLMLQDEAAQRLAGAREGDADWRGASALARYFSEPEVLFGIPARAFLPPPRVDSALVRFRLKRPEERAPRATDEKLLKAVIRAAFAQRRKALKNSLGALVGAEAAAAAVAAAGLDPLSARADAVGVPAFVAIANAIAEATDPEVLAAVAVEEEEEVKEGGEEEVGGVEER